jgi:hypothetical protein
MPAQASGECTHVHIEVWADSDREESSGAYARPCVLHGRCFDCGARLRRERTGAAWGSWRAERRSDAPQAKHRPLVLSFANKRVY